MIYEGVGGLREIGKEDVSASLREDAPRDSLVSQRQLQNGGESLEPSFARYILRQRRSKGYCEPAKAGGSVVAKDNYWDSRKEGEECSIECAIASAGLVSPHFDVGSPGHWSSSSVV